MEPRHWRAHLPVGDPFDVADLTAGGSLPARWAERWAADPRAPLLWDAAAGGGGRGPGGWVCAEELEERTRRAAGVLRGAGLGNGERVLWCVGSSVPAVVANLAALRAGLVVVPANPAYTRRELAHIVTDVRPAAAVVDDPALASWLAAGTDGIAAAGAVLVVGTGTRLGEGADVRVLGGATPVAADASGTGLDGVSADAPALIAYTSGTTGAPKGAVLTHANLLANSVSVARTWRWEPSDRLVHALPVFHGHGLCVALYTTLLVGSSAVLLPRFAVDEVLDASRTQGATMFFGVPTMYHRLAASARAGELGRLRLAVSGSAPLPPELHHRLRARAGTDVLERYGMTETLMSVSNPYEGERRPGTVGFPFPGVEVRLLPREAAPATPGVSGGRRAPGASGEGGPSSEAGGTGGEVRELLVRGPAVFAGYWQRPAATAAAFEGPWFRTGDLADVDDAGYLRLLGRSGDLVISGGFNVYPAEVEDVLLGHPAVAEVAVSGTPSAEWGELVTAWVVPAARPLDVDGLLAWAAQRLAPYKRPRLVHVVDGLPRNALGKVLRSQLR